jgi:hypothetical protein
MMYHYVVSSHQVPRIGLSTRLGGETDLSWPKETSLVLPESIVSIRFTRYVYV